MDGKRAHNNVVNAHVPRTYVAEHRNYIGYAAYKMVVHCVVGSFLFFF